MIAIFLISVALLLIKAAWDHGMLAAALCLAIAIPCAAIVIATL
jgi:hypothetical protein